MYFLLFLGLYGLPLRSGKLNDVSQFDAKFFGVSESEANLMDAQLRMLLEVTYETIVDAGQSMSISQIDHFRLLTIHVHF